MAIRDVWVRPLLGVIQGQSWQPRVKTRQNEVFQWFGVVIIKLEGQKLQEL